MDNLTDTQGFVEFCRQTVQKFKPSDMALILDHDDFDSMVRSAMDFFQSGYAVPGEETSHVLDNLREYVEDELNTLSFDIIATNLYNSDYEFIQWGDTDNPLENVRRSLVLDGGSAIVDFLRTALEEATGNDPYGDPWELV